VEWWPNPEVKLFDVLVHMLAETSRHAGHADILREGIDGAVGPDAESMARKGHDAGLEEGAGLADGLEDADEFGWAGAVAVAEEAVVFAA
jgi:hypothetical protein